LSLNLAAVKNSFACVCPPVAMCTVYSHSKAVFTGKVLKVVRKSEDNAPNLYVTFEVEKAYKGKLEKVTTSQFLDVTCQAEFKEGEKYFVYELERGYGCNPSKPLWQAEFDLKYAESLSESEPVFNIWVFFDSVTYYGETTDYAKNMQVSIANGEKKYMPTTKENGSFQFTTKEKGTYKISILFNYPIQFSLIKGDMVFPDKAKYLTTATQTSLEYEAQFEPNGCDARYFYVFPNKDAK
jgi:hypothetical protein